MWRLMFSVIPCAVWTTALLTLVRPMALPRRLAVPFAGVLAVALAKFTGFALIGGEMFNPDLRAFLIYAWGAAYGFVEIWTALVFLAWTAGLSRRIRRRVAPSPVAARVVAAVAACVAAACVAEGLYETIRVPRVVERELCYPNLPPALDGYRIAHLSDLHASVATSRERFVRVVERVNACKPDLIAITGDFADGFATEMKPLLEPLRDLRANDGVWGCTGNHEYYWDWASLGPELEKLGILFPPAAVEVDRGSAVLRVGSLDDPARDRGVDPDSCPDPFEVFGHDAKAKDVFRLLLVHQPRYRRPYASWAGVDLQLSGHTHGGAAWPLRPLVALFNDSCVCGVYPTGRGWLHVSPGTGQWSGFPIRLFNPTEITVLTLRRR